MMYVKAKSHQRLGRNRSLTEALHVSGITPAWGNSGRRMGHFRTTLKFDTPRAWYRLF